MSNPCTDPSYTCGDTKTQVNHTGKTTVFRHEEDRCFTLESGNVSIDVNKRTRSYAYNSEETWDLAGGKVVVNDLGGEIDCGTVSTSEGSAISEDYETVDCTFLFVDLRNDCFVYEEKTAHLTWNQASPTRIGINDGWGNTYVYPYIDEAVPITRTTRIVCTSLPAEINKEVVNAGYGEGIRVLMPGWDGHSPPRHDIFTMNGVTYDAYTVDWYSQFDNWEADGDLNLWWPAWLRATGSSIIDVDASTKLYNAYHGLETPATLPSSNGIETEDFSGSCAFDKAGNMFFSASFNGGNLKLSKLYIHGTETPIPTDSEADAWYPVSPI